MKIFYMTHSYGQKYILKSCLAVAYLRTEAVFDKKKKVNIFPVMVVIIYTPCCKLFIGKKKLRRNYIPKSKRKNLTVINFDIYICFLMSFLWFPYIRTNIFYSIYSFLKMTQNVTCYTWISFTCTPENMSVSRNWWIRENSTFYIRHLDIQNM